MLNDTKSYGETFKTIRLNKGKDEEEACIGVCSRSTLCRFEIGENDIGLNKFVGLLKNIGVSAEEYFDTIKNFEPNINEKFFQKINQYYYKKDITKLKELLIEFQSSTKKKINCEF